MKQRGRHFDGFFTAHTFDENNAHEENVHTTDPITNLTNQRILNYNEFSASLIIISRFILYR